MLNKSIFFGLILTIILTPSYSQDCDKARKPVSGYAFTDDFPSYQCKNYSGEFDHCLRALQDLPSGTIVGSGDFVKTENEFIALHKSKEFRHVAIMGLKKDGLIQWGKVNGKLALVNHSCDPNCELTDEGYVITIKNIQESEELTIAYDAPIIGAEWNPKWNFTCWCKTEHCKLNINRYDMQKKPRTLLTIE